MSDVGGLGGFGMIACGSALDSDGRVRNLSLSSGDLGTVAVSFDWESYRETGLHRFPLYVDGAHEADLLPGTTSTTQFFPLGSSHEVSVAWLRAGEAAPAVLADAIGARVYLRWGRSSSTDVAAYQVGWDAGDGDASTPALLATLSRMTLDSVTLQAGTTGGRVSIVGVYEGPTANEALTLSVGAAGAWTFSGASSGAIATGAVYGGTTQQIGRGLAVVWHDATASYGNGDSWVARVGPPREYVTIALDADTYRFAVRSVDGTGNASAWSSWLSVAVAALPAPPTGISATWDAATEELTVSWTDSADAAHNRVYLNVDLLRDGAGNYLDLTPGDYILEDGHAARIAAGVETYSVTLAGVTGTIRGYVRTEASSGVVEDNATMFSVVALAAGDSTLAAPLLQSVTGTAGGGVSAVALVDRDPTRSGGAFSDPASVRLYVGTTADTAAMSEAATVAWSSLTLTGSPVASVTLAASGVVSGTAATRYFAVRTIDGSGNLSAWSNVVAARLDDQAPAAVAFEFGGVL